MSELALSSNIAFEKAKEQNLDVVIPDDYTLQVDIDEPYEHWYPNKVLQKKIGCLDVNFGLDPNRGNMGPYNGMLWRKSRNGNVHLYIFLEKPQPAAIRILLQASLGSDGMREILSYKRLVEGDPIPTLFFEVKEQPEQCRSCTTLDNSDPDVLF